MDEKFQIPGVAGIIENLDAKEKQILIQERFKADAPREKGLIEIPAGKIREFENVFETLRREVLEETGLAITEILGESSCSMVCQNDYKVKGFEPFFVSQNLAGYYPIMVMTFLCKARGNILLKSDESANIRWVKINDLRQMLLTDPEKFYPMHISALMKYMKL
jgi:8-oxo-dGTP pyrophosphatase MutT (NUDIX family)